MKEELVEAIAQQLHREYRAAHKALSESPHRHDHGWTFCHNKHYFLKRAKAMLPLLQAQCLLLDPPLMERAVSTALAETFASPQMKQAQALLATTVRAYCALDRKHKETIARLKADLAVAVGMVEDATAAGVAFDYNNTTGRLNARNKLAEKRPTRIIKLPNTHFCTVKLTKCEPVLPFVTHPTDTATESVADATGDSKC